MGNPHKLLLTPLMKVPKISGRHWVDLTQHCAEPSADPKHHLGPSSVCTHDPN